MIPLRRQSVLDATRYRFRAEGLGNVNLARVKSKEEKADGCLADVFL